MAWSVAQRRASKREYQRLYASPKAVKTATVHITVPDDVETFDYVPQPCFKCGVRRGCRHRPWMLSL